MYFWSLGVKWLTNPFFALIAATLWTKTRKPAWRAICQRRKVNLRLSFHVSIDGERDKFAWPFLVVENGCWPYLLLLQLENPNTTRPHSAPKEAGTIWRPKVGRVFMVCHSQYRAMRWWRIRVSEYLVQGPVFKGGKWKPRLWHSATQFPAIKPLSFSKHRSGAIRWTKPLRSVMKQ